MRRKRPCEMRCQVPPEAGGGGGKVGESEAPGLRGTLQPEDMVTDKQ